jgi:hypothetical protein
MTLELCHDLIILQAYFYVLSDDPPSSHYAHADIVQIGHPRSAISLFCPRGCPGAAAAINAFVQALARVEAAIQGLGTAANRFTGARLVGSRSGMTLQAGLGRAYAGELAGALTLLTSRSSVLATRLSAAGETVALTQVQVQQVVTELQTTGLPAAYARVLPAGGPSAATIAQTLKSGAPNPPAALSFAQTLPRSLPASSFQAASHTINAGELSALVDQFASQRSISKKTRTLLHNDLVALARARNGGAIAKALSKLRRDAGHVRGSTGGLLQSAAAGL